MHGAVFLSRSIIECKLTPKPSHTLKGHSVNHPSSFYASNIQNMRGAGFLSRSRTQACIYQNKVASDWKGLIILFSWYQ